jgi:hypothetical protein
MQCRKLDHDRDRPTVCFECDEDSKRCRRKVEFMATMLSRETGRPIQAIIEEWEAELIPPRELYEKILELRAALAETERRSRAAQDKAEERAWRVASEMDIKLEAEKKRVAMLIGLTSESNTEVERLEDLNVDLEGWVGELKEDNDRLYEYLMGWMCPNL